MDSGAVDIRLELQQKKKLCNGMSNYAFLVKSYLVCFRLSVSDLASGLIHLGGYKIFVA